MTYTSLLKKIAAPGAVILMLLAVAAFAFPAKTYAATGLCYDAFAGVSYKCPANPGSVKVEGKLNGKFNNSKCYAFSDPNKGWEVADCKATPFQQPVVIAQPVPKSNAGPGDCPDNLKSSGGCDLVARYLNPLILVATIVVGLIVAIAIVTGGIQYATARDNPQAISAAKTRIAGALVGFLAYSLLWAFLQWIVPGGFLNG